jgi:hypothetical protein
VQRLKHLLRRAKQVMDRTRAHDVRLAHIPDVTQFVDCFTKWCKGPKVEASLAYMLNSAMRAMHNGATAAEVRGAHVAIAVVAAWLDGQEAEFGA